MIPIEIEYIHFDREGQQIHTFSLSPLLYTYKVSLFLYCLRFSFFPFLLHLGRIRSIQLPMFTPCTYIYQDRIVITLVAPCDIIVLKYTYIDMVLFCLLISVSRPLLLTPLSLSLSIYILFLSFFLSLSLSFLHSQNSKFNTKSCMYVLYYQNVPISRLENIYLEILTNVVTLGSR